MTELLLQLQLLLGLLGLRNIGTHLGLYVSNAYSAIEKRQNCE